jgi:hypothetical protein
LLLQVSLTAPGIRAVIKYAGLFGEAMPGYSSGSVRQVASLRADERMTQMRHKIAGLRGMLRRGEAAA